MSFTQIIRAISAILIALSTAMTLYAASMRTAAPEMDQAVRDAYFSYFSSASSRHRIYSQISATPSAMPARYSVASSRTVEMTAGDAAFGLVRLLWAVLMKMIWLLSCYIILPVLLLAALLWSIPVLRSTENFLWIYTTATSRIAALRSAITAVEDDLSYLHHGIGRKYYDIRYNEFTDMAQLKYQLLVNWLGKRKWQISAVLLAMWLAYSINRPHQPTEGVRLVTWAELPRYFDQPIPEVLLRPRKLDGSNSHYVPDVLADLRLDEGLEEVLGEGTVPSPMKTLVGSGKAYCRRCRQSHCCEVY